MLSQKEIVYSKLCPHRGIGEENSLSAIKNGIISSPFMVEFDIQWSINELFLGHPPEITKIKLIDALKLFRNSQILPKIDIKLDHHTINEALDRLIKILNEWKPKVVLVNIDGSLLPDEFMKAEKRIIKDTPTNVLLNIDLERYKNKSNNEIGYHISSLGRPPFSFSPNLEININDIIVSANRFDIKNIHFWSNPEKIYSINDLFNRLKQCEENNKDAYLDIKTTNIIC